MTQQEAIAALGMAKHVLADMGLLVGPNEAERAETKLLEGMTAAQAREYADLVLPRGRRGRIRLVLYSPRNARALAFVAGVLRSIEDAPERGQQRLLP